MTLEQLVAIASLAQSQAYAPYSGFRVGAALEVSDGTVYSGANVENSSYGLTICAERSAVCAAITAGHRSFVRLVVFSSISPPATPCGACRQVLSEFAHELEVICANDQGEVRNFLLKDLLPESFTLDQRRESST